MKVAISTACDGRVTSRVSPTAVMSVKLMDWLQAECDVNALELLRYGSLLTIPTIIGTSLPYA